MSFCSPLPHQALPLFQLAIDEFQYWIQVTTLSKFLQYCNTELSIFYGKAMQYWIRWQHCQNPHSTYYIIYKGSLQIWFLEKFGIFSQPGRHPKLKKKRGQCIVLKFVVIVALNANKCVKRETKRPNIPSKQDHYVAGNSNARERVAHNCINMSICISLPDRIALLSLIITVDITRLFIE